MNQPLGPALQYLSTLTVQGTRKRRDALSSVDDRDEEERQAAKMRDLALDNRGNSTGAAGRRKTVKVFIDSSTSLRLLLH